jgi:hypothetical protein
MDYPQPEYHDADESLDEQWEGDPELTYLREER